MISYQNKRKFILNPKMCNFALGKSSAKTIVAKNTKYSFIMNFFGTGFVSKFFYIFIIGKKSGIFYTYHYLFQ